MLNIGFTYVDASNINAIDECSTIILPGSKLVGKDLQYMEENGILKKLKS